MVIRVVFYASVAAIIAVGGYLFMNRLSYKAFLSGEYSIEVPSSAGPNPGAEAEVVALIQSLQANPKVMQAHGLGEPGDGMIGAGTIPVEQAYASYQTIKKIIGKTDGSDAGLASILILGKASLAWPEKAAGPVKLALFKLRSQFPGTWQAQCAALLEASHLLRTGQGTEGILQAQKILKDNLPPAGGEVAAPGGLTQVVAGVYPVVPFRAAFLWGLADIEFRLGTYPKLDPTHLSEADALAKTILMEFPQSKHAGGAKDLSDRLAPILTPKEPEAEEAAPEKEPLS